MARSLNIKGAKKGELYEVKSILEQRKTKNGRAVEYRIEWEN